MHLSMHNWMRAEPIEVTIRRLAKYGYKSIEISGEPELFDTREVSALLKENGLKCWGSVSLMFEGRDLVSHEANVRETSVEYIKDCITMVKELEGHEMTIVPGQVGRVTSPAEVTGDMEWAWAIECLKEIYAHGEKEGVLLALEPLNRFETNFLNRADQAMLLAEAVGPNCGVCIDTFHLNIEETDMFEAIKSTKERLVDFHVADNNRMACGMGALDWPRIVQTLKGIGYDGAITVEFVAPLDRTPANPYKNAMADAEAELTPEQLKFIEDHGSGVLSEEFYSWLVEETAKTLLPLIN